MKSKKLMDALGEIDDRYLLSVRPDHLSLKHRRWPLALAAAAMVGLCIFGAAQLQPTVREPEVSTEEENSRLSIEELERMLLDRGGEFQTMEGTMPAEPGDLRKFAIFLRDHQEKYGSFLREETLEVSLYQMDETKMAVLYLPNRFERLRLRQDGTAAVTDSIAPWAGDWRNHVAESVQQLLDEAPWQETPPWGETVCRSEEERQLWDGEVEAAKAAFGAYLDAHWSVELSCEPEVILACGRDYQLTMTLGQNGTDILRLFYLGGFDVAASWLRETGLTLEETLKILYENRLYSLNMTFENWKKVQFLPDGVALDGVALDDPVTVEQGLQLLRCTGDYVMRPPMELPDDLHSFLTKEVLENLIEQQRQWKEKFPAGGYTDIEMGEWYTHGMMYVTDGQILPGIDASHFGPEKPISPDDVCTALYLAVSPEMDFDGWKQDRIDWIVQNQIVFSPTFFAQKAITGTDMLSLLYDCATEILHWDGDVPQWAEAEEVSQPLRWARYHEILWPEEHGTFQPDEPVTRVQFAYLLRQLMQKVWYQHLPDGRMVCTEEMQGQQERMEAEQLTREYLNRYGRMRLSNTRENLTADTVTELCEQGSLPQNLLDENQNLLKALLEQLEFFRSKADYWVQYCQKHGIETEGLTLDCKITRVEQHNNFVWLEVSQFAWFRYRGEETESSSEDVYLVTLLQTPEGWAVAGVKDYYDALDWEFEQNGLEAAKKTMENYLR